MSREKSPTLLLAPHSLEIEGEGAFYYLALAKQLAAKGMNIVSFGIGQPDFDTPSHIKEAAKKALDEGFTGYTETQGIKEAREAVADYLNERYGSDVEPDEIILTPGAKGAIFLAMISYLSPGEEALIFEPSYPAYAQAAKVVHAKPVYIPLEWAGSSEGFKLDLEQVEKRLTEKTKMIVFNNPHNPTGAVFDKKQLDELMELARRKNIIVLVDEIYDNFVYDGGFHSLLEYPGWRDNVLVVNGLSKTFAMTGWRMGYLVARKDVINVLSNVAVNFYSCTTSFVQKAVVAAYKGSWEPVKEIVETFRKRRDLLHSLLSEIYGFEVWKPAGAFYIFPRIKKLLDEVGMDSRDFALYLLNNYGVVVLPGTAFPDKAGEGFLRFSYASSFEDIEEGSKRIKKAVEDLLEKHR